jgi:prephenate dehydrogenase
MTSRPSGDRRRANDSGESGAGEVADPVLIVGTGLIGTSIGLALRRHGTATYLRDADPTVAHIAASRGAGNDQPLPEQPQLVVVATPPDSLAAVIARSLVEFPLATVTDVGSVKSQAYEDLLARGLPLDRYVGSHPMAGSERSGPFAASADLFEGRSWALVLRDDSDPEAARKVTALVTACGAVAVPLDTYQHDRAVALVSHVPHVAAALVARQLAHAAAEDLRLSGPGVRDVTRIAAGDPALWRQILTANAAAVTQLLSRLRNDLDEMIESLSTREGSRVESLLAGGVVGAASVPGKHGGPSVELAAVTVAIPDAPGALARLFADVDAAKVNIEDVRIDHDPARAYGLVELDVMASAVDGLGAALTGRGWTLHR